MELMMIQTTERYLTELQYSKLTDFGRIGISPPPKEIENNVYPNCDLKLQPPKRFPKSGKKLYKGLFLRALGHFTHIYDVESKIYIVSILKTQDPKEWVDRNYDRIIDRLSKVKDL